MTGVFGDDGLLPEGFETLGDAGMSLAEQAGEPTASELAADEPDSTPIVGQPSALTFGMDDFPAGPESVDLAEGPPPEDVAAGAEHPPLGESGEVAGELPGGNGPPPGGDGSYDRLAAAAEDYAVLREAVASMVDDLTDITLDPGSPEEKRVAEQILAAARQVLAIAAEILGRGTDQDPDLAFAATAQAQTVRDEARSAWKRYRRHPFRTAWDEAKKILRWLWSMIGHLTTVKEWTVTGQAGGGLFGLAGASVSVTFGEARRRTDS